MKDNKIIKYVLIGLAILVLIIGIYLLVQYNKNEKSVLSLKGNPIIYITTGDAWEDPGCIVTYNGSELDKDIKIDNHVDMTKPGNYEIEYTVKFGIFSKSIKRRIIVVGKDESSFKLELSGSNPYYILKGGTYKEPGYNATDNIDGNLTNKVTITGSVKTNTVGEYNLEYSVINSSGTKKTVIRRVVVYDFQYKATTKGDIYASSKEIDIDISDPNYLHTVLPDEDVTSSRNIKYKVTANGTYIFEMYDKSRNVTKYEVTINDVDTVKPTGSCTLNLYDKSGEIIVKASDNYKLKGYIYYHGNNKTSLITATSYKFNTMDETASVDIFDMANNTINVKCNVVNKATTISRSYTYKTYTASNGRTQGYWHYIPAGSARKKVTLLVYLHGAGSHGNYNDVNKYAFPLFVSRGTNYPYMMIAPHCNSSCSFANDTVISAILEVITYVTNNYNVDSDRIIISGGSAGTTGASKMLNQYGNRFAGMVIVSGYYDYFTMPTNYIKKPMLFIQGKYDSYQVATNIVNKINAQGGNATLSGVSGGHDISERVLDSQEYTNWIISQKK